MFSMKQKQRKTGRREKPPKKAESQNEIVGAHRAHDMFFPFFAPGDLGWDLKIHQFDGLTFTVHWHPNGGGLAFGLWYKPKSYT